MTVAERVAARINIRRSLPNPEQRAALRRSAGLTQQDIADILGVNRTTVAQWESGRRNPSGPVLAAYTEALKAMSDASVDIAA